MVLEKSCNNIRAYCIRMEIQEGGELSVADLWRILTQRIDISNGSHYYEKYGIHTDLPIIHILRSHFEFPKII